MISVYAESNELLKPDIRSILSDALRFVWLWL
jgi:hypothetical protein